MFQIWTILLKKGPKSPQRKKFFYGFFLICSFWGTILAPISRCRMSKIYRDLESFGKSNRKKWTQMWLFFLKNGLKLPRQKKFLFMDFFLSCLFTLFTRLFAPTSHSPMSKQFRFFESLGITNWKKWSQIWILLLIKGVKLPRKKSLIFDKFCLTSMIFWYCCHYPHGSRDALSTVCGIFV